MKKIAFSAITLIIAISLLTSCGLRDVSSAEGLPSSRLEISEIPTHQVTDEPTIQSNPATANEEELVDIVVLGKKIFSLSSQRLGILINNDPNSYGENLTEEECKLIINTIAGEWKLSKIASLATVTTGSGIEGFYDSVNKWVQEQLTLPVPNTIFDLSFEGIDMSTAIVTIYSDRKYYYSDSRMGQIDGLTEQCITIDLPMEVDGTLRYVTFLAGSGADFYYTDNNEDNIAVLLWLLERVE